MEKGFFYSFIGTPKEVADAKDVAIEALRAVCRENLQWPYLIRTIGLEDPILRSKDCLVLGSDKEFSSQLIYHKTFYAYENQHYPSFAVVYGILSPSLEKYPYRYHLDIRRNDNVKGMYLIPGDSKSTIALLESPLVFKLQESVPNVLSIAYRGEEKVNPYVLGFVAELNGLTVDADL
jgi:hypothetical protein